jgi:hypothetical protein
MKKTKFINETNVTTLMRTLIMVTMSMTLVLSFFAQLVVIAQDSSETTLSFADNMNLQLKCTHDGIPLSECQTNKTTQQQKLELEEQLRRTQLALAEFEKQSITQNIEP